MPDDRKNRREVSAAALAMLSLQPSSPQPDSRKASLRVACFIRYQIDPFQREAFASYAENWARIIPACGGHLIGYFLPYEGTNDIAWGLIAFDSLTSYEAYRRKLRENPEARANFALAQSKRLVLREERSFLEIASGTFEISAERR